MAFRVLPNGTIETDSAEEALEVARLRSGKESPSASSGAPIAAPKPSVKPEVAKLLELLTKSIQRSISDLEEKADPAHVAHEPLPAPTSAVLYERLTKVLSVPTIHTRALYDLGRRGELTIKEFRQAYDVDSNQGAAGMIRALRLMLLRSGLDPTWVFDRDKYGPSRGDDTRYKATRLLELATKETPMPEPREAQESNQGADDDEKPEDG